jgi:uncharacterized protein YjaG (DUF416 family)
MMILFSVSMLVVGWIIFRVITQREERDTDLKKKLDDDDRRAAIGRGEIPPESQ